MFVPALRSTIMANRNNAIAASIGLTIAILLQFPQVRSGIDDISRHLTAWTIPMGEGKTLRYSGLGLFDRDRTTLSIYRLNPVNGINERLSVATQVWGEANRLSVETGSSASAREMLDELRKSCGSISTITYVLPDAYGDEGSVTRKLIINSGENTCIGNKERR